MRRKMLLVAALVAVLSLSAALPASAGAVLPYRSHPRGQTYAGWLRDVGQWFLGDSSNPLIGGLDGACGEMRDGVYFMVAPITLDAGFDCDVPTGTPIVLSHAGWFTTQGIDGSTDEELEAAAVGGFTVVTDTLTLDGRPLPLQVVDTGAYDVTSQAGGFYDMILGLGTGSIRTVVRGNVVFLHPLPPGDHVIEAEVLFANGDHYSATYTIHVG